jgi:hypothetical protein
MFSRMLKLPEEVRRHHDVSSLRTAIHGAAPCPVPVKHSNSLAVLNHNVPGVPTGTGRMSSSSTCNSPSRTLPTVPGWASHSALSQ